MRAPALHPGSPQASLSTWEQRNWRPCGNMLACQWQPAYRLWPVLRPRTVELHLKERLGQVGCQSPKIGKHERENMPVSDVCCAEHVNTGVHACNRVKTKHMLKLAGTWNQHISLSNGIIPLFCVGYRVNWPAETSHDTSKWFGFNCGQLSSWTFYPLLFLKAGLVYRMCIGFLQPVGSIIIVS